MGVMAVMVKWVCVVSVGSACTQMNTKETKCTQRKQNVDKQNKTYYTTNDTKRCVMSAQWYKLCSAWCFKKQSVSALPV